MNTTKAIHRNSWLYFCLIPAFAVWGFWQSYFLGEVRPVTVFDHAHGISMFAWCAMLVLQAFLIREGARGLHRVVGRMSYVVVPIIALSSLALANQQLNARGLTEDAKFILLLQVSILAQFLIFYALAITNRKRPDKHARYMICTALPLIDPIFARILMLNVLTPDQFWMTQYVTYALTDLILIALVIWDWRTSRRKDVFLPMLVVIVALQIPTLVFADSAGWNAFSEWFIRLPIS